MALVIEDGSGVSGAQSYVTLAEVQAYATLRGITTILTEAMVVEAKDYLESLRDEYQGTKMDRANALQWPRSGAFVDGFEIEETEIPTELKSAQCQLAIDAASADLLPTNVGGKEVIMERVEGAVEVQYAPSGDNNPQPKFSAAMSLLAPLLKGALFGGGLRAVRV